MHPQGLHDLKSRDVLLRESERHAGHRRESSEGFRERGLVGISRRFPGKLPGHRLGLMERDKSPLEPFIANFFVGVQNPSYKQLFQRHRLELI
jgi:hypothetical protein